MRMVSRILAAVGLAATLGLAAGGAGAQQIVNEGDPVFLRFPDLRERYFRSAETKIAQHKYVTMPMPRQCAYFYVDIYSKPSMSDRDTRNEAVNRCNANLRDYGSLSENYAVACDCRIVIARDKYRLGADELPSMGYAPVSLFYRDTGGRSVAVHGYAEFDLQFRPGSSGQLTIFTPRGQPACTGTVNTPGATAGNYSLSCFGGRFTARGDLSLVRGKPKEHTIGRGRTPQGGPVNMVIGLPSAPATSMYGSL